MRLPSIVALLACLASACQPANDSGDNSPENANSGPPLEVVEREALPPVLLGKWTQTRAYDNTSPQALEFSANTIVEDLSQVSLNGQKYTKTREITRITETPSLPNAWLIVTLPSPARLVKLEANGELCLVAMLVEPGKSPEKLACYRKA